MSLNKILTAIAIFLVTFIIAVSAIALFKKNLVPGAGLRKIDPSPKESGLFQKKSFDLVGQLRISTKTEDTERKSILLLNPWLEFDSDDTALYEELDRKLPAIKSIFLKYFQSHTKNELLAKDETQIKNELKAQINETLVLGKISEIYFKDYIFLS